jgi:hypothetical protein
MNRAAAFLFALQLVGNALLLSLGYYWLGIGESDAAHLAWSTLVVIAFAGSALWLHGTALAFFHHDIAPSFVDAVRTALRHVLPLVVVGIAAAIIYGLLAYWHDSFGHKAFVIGSYATMKLRKPVPPASVLRWYQALVWLLRWLVVPAVVFPLAANVAASGWAGFRLHSLRRCRNPLYWIEVCALLLLAVWVPLKLIRWIPQIPRFEWQIVSFLGRAGVAYLLFVAALLALEFVTSAGRPRLSQPNTASAP